MQTQNASPEAGPRTILLGRNRLGTFSEPRGLVVKSFERQTKATRPAASIRKPGKEEND
jgi:hypothetical protein